MILRWAAVSQALDNESPAVIIDSGEPLDDELAERRTAVASWVASLARCVADSLEAKQVRVVAAADEYLIEVPTEQVDSLGRTSIIVFCAETKLAGAQDIGSLLAEMISSALPTLGRTVSDETLGQVRSACSAIQRARRARRRTYIGAAAVVVAFTAAAVAWEVFRDRETPPNTKASGPAQEGASP